MFSNHDQHFYEHDVCYLLTGWRQLVGIFSQHSEVINNGLQVCHLSQHGNFYVLEGGDRVD